MINIDMNVPEFYISTYSNRIIDKFLTFDNVKIITNLITANGEKPVYKIKYGGKNFAFYLSLVGSPASVSCFEEVIALGAKKFVFSVAALYWIVLLFSII